MIHASISEKGLIKKNPSKKNYDENAYSDQTLSTKNSGATTKDDLEEYICLATKKSTYIWFTNSLQCLVTLTSVSTNEDYNAINAEHSFNLYVMIGIMCMWMVPQRSGIYSTFKPRFDMYAFIHGSEVREYPPPDLIAISLH